MFNIRRPEGVGAALKIIIVGCGKVGAALAEQLCREGHDVTIIDTNAKKIQEITNQFDVMGVTGNGASYRVQEEANIKGSDLFIAMTGSDELNLLCCTIAKNRGNCSTIARVRTPDYNHDITFLRSQLGLSMIINPELEAAREAERILSLPNALEVNSFANDQVELIKIKVPEHSLIADIPISRFGKETGGEILICAVEREEDVFIPSGDFILKEGDTINFVAKRKSVRKFFAQLGFQTNRVNNTMILGGGKVSYYLADRLLQSGISVKIIENNEARCEELSTLLPKAMVINGDCTDQELLDEEGIAYAESVAPLTNMDEVNVLLTLYAKQSSHAKVVTKINRGNFENIINALDLGSVLYPRYITCERILAFVRAKQASKNSKVESVTNLFSSRAEAVAFRVKKESDVTDVALMNLPLKKDLLISFINRKGQVIIPNGQETIQVDDLVMIVTTHTGLNDIEDILA